MPLALTRRIGEELVVADKSAQRGVGTITLVDIHDERARIGLNFDSSYMVLRSELLDKHPDLYNALRTGEPLTPGLMAELNKFSFGK